jgi:RHS repeat-associated protein
MTNKVMFFTTACRRHLALILALGFVLGTTTRLLAQDVATQVSQVRIFNQTLHWVGEQSPPAGESQAILQAFGVFQTNGVNAGLVSLENFLVAHPQSAWAPALHVGMAEYYRSQGRYTPALTHWQAAWGMTKDSKDAGTQKLAVRAISGWTRLLASLGETEKLETLFAELQAKELPLGVYATVINETKEGLGIMESRPGLSYRCGSYALGFLAKALHLSHATVTNLFATDSPNGGFHISQLLQLGQSNNLELAAVRRPVGAEIVVPSVVHWRLNHYAAIVEKKGNFYRVEDPTFESHVWLTAATIDEEAGGEFLVPANLVPAGWAPLTEKECLLTYGKGFPACLPSPPDPGPPTDCPPDGDDDSEDSTCDPQSSGDGASDDSGGPPPPQCPDCGMPQWSVSEPYITLWLRDVPLLYRQSNGHWMKLRLSYKSRGDVQDSQYGGFGDKWSCNWLGSLQAQVSSDGGSGLTFDNIAIKRVGGGQENFTAAGLPNYATGRRFTQINKMGVILPGIALSTGAIGLYSFGIGDLTGNTNYLLTQRIDCYGRLLKQMNYVLVSGITRMTNVLDIDGRTNTLYYGNSSYPNLITAVTDPYGRTASFNYNASGLLTNIVDAAGMSTYFQYDSSENITNMVTPYGTNKFKYYDERNPSDSYALTRSIQITEASGDHQLYVYMDDAFADFGDMTTYHWNRAQYELITSGGQDDPSLLTADDFYNASVKHWLHADTTDGSPYPYTVSDSLSQQASAYDPVAGNRLNWFVYNYQGQSLNHTDDGVNPALKRVTAISLGSGTKLVDITRNSLGRPTSFTYHNVDEYNDTIEPDAVYTNIFDTSGSILKEEYGPRGERVRGYGYDSVQTNLLVSVTNAMGDVLRYTHDPTTLKVTSTIFPTGLIRTNIYYASGPNQGFLFQQIDIGFRTNSFVYTNGNIWIQTNELGLVTTNTYDNLNRLTSTRYPDNTTISNVYNNLDIVATKDRMDQWAHYGFNQVRQLLAATNVNGQITSYSYCGCGSPDAITRWNGATPLTTYYAYNTAGMVTNIEYPDGYNLGYVYDPVGLLSTITDNNTNQLYYIQVFHGTKPLTYYQSLNLGNGHFQGQVLAQTIFDEYGRSTNVWDRKGFTTAFDYDFLSRLTYRQMFMSPYNYLGEVDSGPETFAYDASGITNYTDQLGHATVYVRDLSSRVIYETNANNEVQRFAYDPANNLLALTDGKNQVTRWNYDLYGRATNKVDATGIVIFRYQYDPNDRLTNRWTAAKGYTTYKYDPIGNLTNVLYQNSGSLIYGYDDVNRLVSMADAIGSTAFKWTDGDLLSSEDGPWNNDSVNYDYNSVRQYTGLNLDQPDATSWKQIFGYDDMMRLSEIISPAGPFHYSYLDWYSGSSDQISTVYYPNVTSSEAGYDTSYIGNSYDGLSRINRTALNTINSAYFHYNPPILFQYAYDEGSQRTQQVFTAGNFINYTYDNIGQLKTAQGFEPDGTTVRQNEQSFYQYDAAWNLASRTNNNLGQIFTVDNLNEVTNIQRAGGKLTVSGNAWEFRYPDYGPGVTNVTVSGTGLSSGLADLYIDGSWARTNASTSTGLNTYTAIAKDSYNRSSTYTTSVTVGSPVNCTYDTNGNLLVNGPQNYAYNDENQLIAIWQANTWSNNFAYDGLMRKRIERDYAWTGSIWLKTNEVHYVYNGNLVIQERDQNNIPLVTYTRGIALKGNSSGTAGGIGGLLARTDNSELIAGNPHANAYYFSDGNGNVAGMFDTNGVIVARYTYDPFGNLLTMSGSLAAVNKYRFSSKEWNENSGLYYYGYRFYNPTLQRWINRDPIEEVGGFNLFCFCLNSMINACDFFGLDCYRQNRQLWPRFMNHSPWPRSRYNPISHTYIFTTNPDGSLKHTYSWGTDKNPRGWAEDYQPDRDAANQALKDGGNALNKIGDSSLDKPTDDAFHDLQQNEPQHANGIINNNCKSEATTLEDKAKDIQQQEQNSCDVE